MVKEREADSKKKKSKSKKEGLNAKMLAISIIFILLFVSFAVFITTQEGPKDSKDMVFYQDNENPGNYIGNVRDVNIDLANIKMKIWDESSKSSNSTLNVQDGVFLDTKGNFTCTYFDKNSNGRLDPSDEFIIENANQGDLIRITYQSSDSEIAFYRFSAPF